MTAEITPGPGWWKAADNEWYPPRWEYMWVRGFIDPTKKHQEDIKTELDEYGSQVGKPSALCRTRHTQVPRRSPTESQSS